jgi:carbamate kinase
MRVLVALGGNAMTGPDGSARPEEQIAAAETAMASVADLVVAGYDVVITHGNGPQVGNLLVKNELSASVVPPVPLDWCGAQTQATLGFILMDALEPALAARDVRRPVAAVITRTRVDADDPAFSNPTKPIGRYLRREDAEVLVDHGQTFHDLGERGWRRVVPSPEPREILDAGVVATLCEAGHIVVANGGGGIPVVRDLDGALRGVEAVIDKDLGAALLAHTIAVDRLVIATDVDHAVLGYGTPQARPIGTVSVDEMRGYAREGHFASGSMGPKVEAVCRFVEASGNPGVITSLQGIVAGVSSGAGTVVVPTPTDPDAGAGRGVQGGQQPLTPPPPPDPPTPTRGETHA